MSTCRCIMRDVEKILPQECSDRLNNNFPIESGKLWFITLGADINLTFTGANVKIFLLFSHLSFPSFSPRRWRSSRFIFWHAKKGFVSSRRLYVSSALFFFMLWMKWKSSLSENICGKFLFIAFSLWHFERWRKRKTTKFLHVLWHWENFDSNEFSSGLNEDEKAFSIASHSCSREILLSRVKWLVQWNLLMCKLQN